MFAYVAIAISHGHHHHHRHHGCRELHGIRHSSIRLTPTARNCIHHLPTTTPLTMSAERSQRLGALQNGVIGSLAGTIEVMIQQPTIAIKNAVQQHLPINWTPPALYRGVGVSLASIAPISALQFAINGKALEVLHPAATATTPASDSVKITAAAISGALSAVLASPAELVMTLQQNSGHSFVATVRDVARQHGVLRLFRGMEITMMRESVWCASYLALGPVLSVRMHQVAPSVFGNNHAEATTSQRASASFMGSLVAGLVTVYATQPLDTVKTVMQGEALTLPRERATLAMGAARHLLVQQASAGKGALPTLYRGSVARGGRLVGAVIILGQARDLLEEWFDDNHILENTM